MKLLILLNGHKDKLFKVNKLVPEEFEVRKIDEKLLASVRQILKILKGKRYEKIYFGCIELELQRFQFFMLFYIFLSLVNRGSLIDENGREVKYNLINFVFVKFPLIFAELLLSVFVVIFYYIKFPVLKWYLKVN